MSFFVILIIILSVVIVFWVAPCVVMTFALFYGHWDEAVAMDKAYYVPLRDKMEEAISFLDSLKPRRVSAKSHDGTELSARWFDCGGGKTVILAHGFKASAYSNCCMQARWFWEKGYNLLMIDQRAHGLSGGKATTFGLTEKYDIISWMDWCKENTATEKLVCYGVSMGSAAVALASVSQTDNKMDLMVLDCGFSSMAEQMDSVSKKMHIPWKLMSPLVGILVKLLLHCDTGVTVCDALEKTRVPAFFVHGTADTVVEFEQGMKNYNCCSSIKDAVFVEGAQHTTAFAVGGEEIEKRLAAFLDKNLV